MSVSEKFQKSQRRWDSFIPLLGGAKDGGKTPWDPHARLLCAPPAPLASGALGSPSRLGRTGQVRPATQGHQAGWAPEDAKGEMDIVPGCFHSSGFFSRLQFIRYH